VVQSASMLNNDFFDLTELRSAITARITAWTAEILYTISIVQEP
jgi:hypothetical protein